MINIGIAQRKSKINIEIYTANVALLNTQSLTIGLILKNKREGIP
jgi:hypothetical protein